MNIKTYNLKAEFTKLIQEFIDKGVMEACFYWDLEKQALNYEPNKSISLHDFDLSVSINLEYRESDAYINAIELADEFYDELRENLADATNIQKFQYIEDEDGINSNRPDFIIHEIEQNTRNSIVKIGYITLEAEDETEFTGKLEITRDGNHAFYFLEGEFHEIDFVLKNPANIAKRSADIADFQRKVLVQLMLLNQ